MGGKHRIERKVNMQKRMILIGLAATLFFSIGYPVFAQEKGQMRERGKAMRERGKPMRGMEDQRKKIELDERRSVLNFENEMREIQLKQKRMQLDRQWKDMQAKGQQQYQGKKNWRGHHKMKHCIGFMFLCIIVHLLLAIWVYQDIRRRNMGSGIWIVVTLLTGFFGALLYAIVRLGDKSAPA